jgi:RimJ/RimL family protein N-acetyltransferase
MSVAASSNDIVLRPTERHDLDFVLALERHPENAPFVGQWSREEHTAAIDRPDREHWIVEVAGAPDPVGFLIAYDLRATGFGVHVKRIVVTDKSRGVGRCALRRFIEHAVRDLAPACIWLTVFAENVRAQRCYAALGFREAALTTAERRLYQDAVDFSDASKVMLRMRRFD